MKYVERTAAQAEYIDSIVEYCEDTNADPATKVFTRAGLREVSMRHKGSKWIPNWITHDQSRRSGRGEFIIPEVAEVRMKSHGVTEIYEDLQESGIAVEV
jgi:hypothetical protein